LGSPTLTLLCMTLSQQDVYYATIVVIVRSKPFSLSASTAPLILPHMSLFTYESSVQDKPDLAAPTQTIETQDSPIRIVLAYRERPFQDQKMMTKAFYDWKNIQPLDDYCMHICFDPNPHTSKMYLVLDIHCKTYPDVDLAKLDVQVFKVSQNPPALYVILSS
jgi:hypothetical protein